jgi:hypothetical protein
MNPGTLLSGAQQAWSDNFWNKGHKHDGDDNPRCEE